MYTIFSYHLFINRTKLLIYQFYLFISWIICNIESDEHALTHWDGKIAVFLTPTRSSANVRRLLLSCLELEVLARWHKVKQTDLHSFPLPNPYRWGCVGTYKQKRTTFPPLLASYKLYLQHTHTPIAHICGNSWRYIFRQLCDMPVWLLQ